MRKIIETLQGNMNPFSEIIDKESVFNTGSGKAALPQTAGVFFAEHCGERVS